ncbi:MAG: hypothetical protein AW07_03002 [Candidatus Accumulibacter sp. SK-11]|nr:MAG: hypothetical protein AW07_03002 [Candidatus Accumulibacter sp. SK-11]
MPANRAVSGSSRVTRRARTCASAATWALCAHSRSANSRSLAVAGAASCRLTTALASARR